MQWSRALLPPSKQPPRRDPSEFEQRFIVIGDFAELANREGHHIGSDGSGGKAAQFPRLRRVGAGAAVATFDQNGDVIEWAAVASNVQGRQTVPRAEVMGAALGARSAGRPRYQSGS